MQVYIILFIVEMLLGFAILGSSPSDARNKKKAFYLILSTILLALVCGMRSISVGYDTEGYATTFYRTSDSIRYIFENEQHVETGFAALCTLIKLLGGDFSTLLLVCSFFTIGATNVFIYRHSPNVLMSTFIIICFPFYYSSFDIIRHFLSAACFLLGFKYIIERRFFRYSIYVLVGVLFHTSSLIYFLFYPLLNLQFNRRNAIFIGASGLVLMLFASVFANYIVEVTGKYQTIASEWIGGFSGGLLTMLMYMFIFFIAKKAAKNQRINEFTKHQCLIIIYVLAVLSVIFIEVRIVTRYIMLFAGLMAIAVPILLNKNTAINVKTNKKYQLIFISIGLAYHYFMLYTNWQNIIPYIPYYMNPLN